MESPTRASQLRDVLSSSSRALLGELSEPEYVRFGDEIELVARSVYMKRAKPTWYGGEPDWTTSEAQPGPVGVYRKTGRDIERATVPPKGELVTGELKASHFRVENPNDDSNRESDGKVVRYGERVVLVDDTGRIWSNKSGEGMLWDGYLVPKRRGARGTVIVSFFKCKKELTPVCYGDPGVFIDVEESNRFRSGFNRRITNFKKPNSRVYGGYLCSDGSGEEISFNLKQYKGAILPREGDVALRKNLHKSSAPPVLNQSNLRISHVSAVTQGQEDSCPTPSFGENFVLFGLTDHPDMSVTVHVELNDGSRAMIDASMLLTPGQTSTVALSKMPKSGTETAQLEISWEPEIVSPKPRFSKTTNVVSLVPWAVALCVAYVSVYVLFVHLMPSAARYLVADAESSRLLSALFFRELPANTVSLRAAFSSVLVCWVLGLLTPELIVNSIDSTENAYDLRNRVCAIKCLSYSPLPYHVRKEEDELADSDDDEKPCDYELLGTNRDTGEPNHPAFVRFYNGEKGDLKVALERWHKTCEWRRLKQVDSILDRPHNKFDIIQKYYPSFFHGRSKLGHPVYYEKVCDIDISGMRKAGVSLDDVLEHYVYMAEFGWKRNEPAEWGQSVTVLDVRGKGVLDLVGESKQFILKAMDLIQEHFPERGAKIFVINTGSFFRGAWAVLRRVIPETTKNKITLIGTDVAKQREALMKWIDEDQLPIEYGGSPSKNSKKLGEADEHIRLRNTVYMGLKASDTPMLDLKGKPVPGTPESLRLHPKIGAKMDRALVSKFNADGVRLATDDGVPIKLF